ncbi:MAG: hypothetical protein AAF657_19650 [Acidobacteriota bacterium]
MALRFSEMIALRTDLALDLEAGFDHSIDEIAQRYASYLAPHLVAGEVFDARLQLVLLRRAVADLRQRLERLDQGVLGPAQEAEKISAEIIHQRDAVDAKLRRVRTACRALYGRGNLGRIGFHSKLPRGPLRLYRYGRLIKASLQNPDFDLEPLLDLDLDRDDHSTAARLAAQLEPELADLGDLLGERHQEKRKGINARLQRQHIIRQFDREIRAIVRLAQGMFRLAGRDDLAERFRPALRRIVRRIKKAQAAESDSTPTQQL